MRRTERLFRIIQTLRGARRAMTGRELADELEVSLRTLYRDIAELMAQRVPVRGEAGTGYVLDKGYDLPPLMLTPDELEEVIRLTADPRLLDALVRPAGAVWYKPTPVPATKEALKAVGKLLHESGEFVSCMHDGVADAVWESHEVAILEKRGMDVIREVLGIMAGARQAMEDRDNG